MAITFNNVFDLFWKLFNIAGGGSEPDVTKVLDSIVKSDRAKLDQYFTNSIDQIAFDTADWDRLRAFFIDLFTANRSMITNSAAVTDPHFLSNDDLDELFRSFGFPESNILKSFDNNPLENKVNLFLDLVNLYKIKGTPRSILEVLQYYGIPELDIFEFWLQKEDASSLIFRGDVIVGTSTNPSPITLPFNLLTQGDPHWMMSEDTALQLDAANKINLPSKTPYFAVQPIVEVGIENAILVRIVQDQYDTWAASGDPKVLPPQNADITILGVTTSLLELYLLTLYSFQEDYQIGTNIQKFACYDGSATTTAEIMDEYNALISEPILRARYLSELTPNNRTAYNSTDPIAPISKWERYEDLFTRERDEHFLYNKGDNAAETVLNIINPDLIPELNALTATNTIKLQSLLKDLALWVRNNVGFGFVNLGYIFFGLSQLFKDLKPVIDFFKPYRARLIVLEMLQFKNLLTESIPLNDAANFTIDTEIFDYMTSNSIPCCTGDSTAAVLCDSTGASFYSRDTYDCGSYHDIGAVTDFSKTIEIHVDQNVCDNLRCPPGCPPGDTTAGVTTNETNQQDCGDLRCGDTCVPYWLDGTTRIISYPILDGTTWTTIDYEESAYIDAPSCFPNWICNGTDAIFVDCTAVVPLTCETIPIVHSNVILNTLEHIENLKIGSSSITVTFPDPMVDTSYILNVNMLNEYDGFGSSMYGLIITNKTTAGFTVLFSSPLDSVRYQLSWSVDTPSVESGVDNLTYNSNTYRVSFPALAASDYTIATSIVNEIEATPSIYNFIVTEKSNDGFTLQFNSPIDSTNYNLEWNVNSDDQDLPNGLVNIPYMPPGTINPHIIVPVSPNQKTDTYSLGITLINTDDSSASIYSYLVTNKNSDDFTVKFSSPIDSTNYYLSWAITYGVEEDYLFRQESGFRMFDTMGRFDCSHGFDMVEISIDLPSQTGVILTEFGGWLLQEAAIDDNLDEYGLLWI